jgi:hypothetical protein
LRRSATKGVPALASRWLPRISVALFAGALAASATSGGMGAAQRLEPAAYGRDAVLLGPEILVSRNESYGHVEPAIAAAPNGQLLAAAISLTGGEADLTEAYSSRDGGNSWSASTFDGLFTEAGDPQAGYGDRGEALLATLASLARKPSTHGVALLARSDGHWKLKALLPIADRPMLFMDNRAVRRASVYVSGMNVSDLPGCSANPRVHLYRYSCIRYTMTLYRSLDGGSHFSGPYRVISATPGFGINSENSPQVLSDGRLAYPFVKWSNLDPRTTTARHYVAVSGRHSLTFSTPRLIAAQRLPPATRPYLQRIAQGLAFVADRAPGPNLDRLYAAWTVFTGTGLRVVAAHSANGGRTWSRPVDVSPISCTRCLQYMPSVAVAPDGTVGIMWLDTRVTKNPYVYDAYFAASVDGGRTFLPARRVSSESSYARNAGNLTPISYFGSVHENGTLAFNVATAFSRFPAGGDYLEIAADDKSIFHLLWPDSRTAAFQLYTCRAWVGPSPAPTRVASASIEDVTADVDILTDPMSYDPKTGVYEIPVRLRNVSEDTLVPPFYVETTADFTRVLPGASILNADNRRTTSGAEFAYGETIRDDAALPPGGVTGARVWRLKVQSTSEVLFNLPVRVYGSVLARRRAP